MQELPSQKGIYVQIVTGDTCGQLPSVTSTLNISVTSMLVLYLH